jgi:hypothetical protein
MERYAVELHALACEIADVDGLTYDEALARARRELGAVEQYAHVWDQGAAYLEVLTVLDRGERPTAAQLDTLMRQDRVVAYVLQHGV